MKKLSVKLAVLSIALLGISGCQKNQLQENPELVPKTLSAVEALAENNGNLDKIAKQLAVALRQKEMRAFVKAEASKMFDGDYDILYRNARHQYVNGKTLKEHLVDKSKNSTLTFDKLDAISDAIPLLNISVPVNIDKWDATAFTPLVAIVPEDYDDKTATKIKAYDADGKIHWLDAATAPDVPVIAVGISERAEVRNGEVVSKFKRGSTSSKKRPATINNILPNGKRVVVARMFNDGEAGGGGDEGTSCSRTDGQWEYMNAIKFPGTYLQSQYEDWILGAPEIRISMFKPTENFTKLGLVFSHFYEPEHRADVNDDWDHMYGSWPLFMWYTADYGNIVLYKMIEEDSGQIVEITVSGTFEIPIVGTPVNLSAKLNIKNDDDEGPTTPVDFRDTRCERIYGDQSFQFHLTNQ